MPTVSVILPNYNHARYLPRRIESILNQSFADFELLIMDDHSPDNSRQVIDRYSDDVRVRVHVNEKNSGNTYIQWNKGIELTEGDFIWIAESDDYSDPNVLSRLHTMLQANERAGLAFCETVAVDQDDCELGWYIDAVLSKVCAGEDFSILNEDFIMDGMQYLKKFMFPWNTIPNASGVLFRRSSLISVGGPITSMKLCGDWLLYCKILSKFDVCHCSSRLNYFRQHPVNVRTNIDPAVLAREWLNVAEFIERQVGEVDRTKRRQTDQFVADALLGAERSGPDNRVPIQRMPAALSRAARIEPRLLLPTGLSLLRQGAGSLSRSIRRTALSR